MRSRYDVVVAGAGPAGGLAAWHLASAGHAVLILDRARLPRYKPCGGGVTVKALRELPFPIDAVVERQVSDADIWFGRDRVIRVRGAQIGPMVMRSAFDEHIVREAVAAGAELRDATAVRDVRLADGGAVVVTDAGEVQARGVIGADGANSVVAKSLGLGRERQWGVAIEAEVDVPAPEADAQIVVFDFRTVPSGYAYVFPKARHLSVGVYTTRPSLPGLRARLDDFIRAGAALRRGTVRSVVGHRVPLGRVSGPLHRGGVALVGDAAGIGDPMWGEGISYALKSGRIAAEVMAAGLGASPGVPGLEAYDRRIRREIAGDLGYARAFASLFYRFPRGRAASLARDPVLSEGMMGILRGSRSYRRFILTVLGRLPAVLVRRIVDRRGRAPNP